MVKLFVDDRKVPSDVVIPGYNINRLYKEAGWTMIRSYQDFVDYILPSKTLPDVISFDHDLTDEHQTFINKMNSTENKPDFWFKENVYDKMVTKCGFHCAQWLVDYCVANGYELPICFVHAANIQGSKNILAMLELYNIKKITQKAQNYAGDEYGWCTS